MWECDQFLNLVTVSVQQFLIQKQRHSVHVFNTVIALEKGGKNWVLNKNVNFH